MHQRGLNMADFVLFFKLPFWPYFFQIIGAPSWMGSIEFMHACTCAHTYNCSLLPVCLSDKSSMCMSLFFSFFFSLPYQHVCVGHCKKMQISHTCFDIPSGKASIFHVGKTCLSCFTVVRSST